MRYLSIDYLSARSLSDCRSSLHNDLPKHRPSYEIPQYGTRYGGTVTMLPVHCNPTIETVSKLFHFVFLFSCFGFFHSVFCCFRCVSVPADFYVSVFIFVNRFIIFPLTDIFISVSANRNHTVHLFPQILYSRLDWLHGLQLFSVFCGHGIVC